MNKLCAPEYLNRECYFTTAIRLRLESSNYLAPWRYREQVVFDSPQTRPNTISSLLNRPEAYLRDDPIPFLDKSVEFKYY